MNDSLGDRMKRYEEVTKSLLPRRTYSIIRLDGKSFHTYTKHLERPYDWGLMDDMDHTAAKLCREISGAICAYVQSDEISILVCDFQSIFTEPWFGGNIQKIVSVSASICTLHFNRRREMREPTRSGSREAFFDSRVFSIPDPTEVYNYFVWRQKDATRNSISSAAQSMLSHKELQGKNTDEQQEMMFQYRGVNWNDYPEGFKRGRLVGRVAYEVEVPDMAGENSFMTARHKWQNIPTPIFTQSNIIQDLIPKYEKGVDSG